jgi:hypothetical protein
VPVAGAKFVTFHMELFIVTFWNLSLYCVNVFNVELKMMGVSFVTGMNLLRLAPRVVVVAFKTFNWNTCDDCNTVSLILRLQRYVPMGTLPATYTKVYVLVTLLLVKLACVQFVMNIAPSDSLSDQLYVILKLPMVYAVMFPMDSLNVGAVSLIRYMKLVVDALTVSLIVIEIFQPLGIL